MSPHDLTDIDPITGLFPPDARITFLINSMEGGGAERAMATLLHHLLPHLNPAQVELVLLDDLPRLQSVPEGLKVTTLDGRGSMLRSLGALRRHWRTASARPDVCVSFLARANVVNVWLARRFGHRVIISERVQTSSHIAASRAAPALAQITRWIYPRAHHVVAVSQGVADDLAANFAVSPNRMSVIHNVVDATHLMRLASEALEDGTLEDDLPANFFVAMGRLVPNKNFQLTLKAYARLDAQDTPLLVLGQGPEEANLKDQATALGIADRVHFLGFVPNPYPIVARARALVSASRAEGFPNTLIEAMCLGCPIIATDCPSGPADILQAQPRAGPPWSDTAAGILVEMEDVDALASAMASLQNDNIQTDYILRAKNRAADYGVLPVIQAYKTIISDALNFSINDLSAK